MQEAINLIEANKISSTEIGDVLGKTGQVEGVHALNQGMFKAGEVKVIYAINNSNYEVHKQLAESDDITKAIVINGKLRDAHTLIKEKYPVWLQDVSPIGCVNRINGPEIDPAVWDNIKSTYDGSIMVCDDSGVVMIPKDKIDEKLITKLHFIEFQEDIWFYCVDTLKMTTFDTVCMKKYLEGDILDKKLLEKLAEFQKNM